MDNSRKWMVKNYNFFLVMKNKIFNGSNVRL